MSNILLIGDIVGYGNLGMSVMIPILSKMGYGIYRMPTSIVSNNFSYGKFAVLDTTDYMSQCIDIWENIGFSADAVATGYLVSERQTRMVADYCLKLKARGTRVFVDPIMADDGKLYNGATEKTIDYMREICKVADLMVPNFTEAKFLAGKYIGENSLTYDEAVDLAGILHEMSGGSVVVSSMVIDDKHCTFLLDDSNGQCKIFPYNQIPAQFSGTGDVFASILFGQFLKNVPIQQSVQNAMDFVYDMIVRNQNSQKPENGIMIEKFLNDIV